MLKMVDGNKIEILHSWHGINIRVLLNSIICDAKIIKNLHFARALARIQCPGFIEINNC